MYIIWPYSRERDLNYQVSLGEIEFFFDFVTVARVFHALILL